MFQSLFGFTNENENNFYGNNEMSPASLIQFPNYDSYNSNQFSSLYEDDILYNLSQIPSNYLIQSENKKNITPKDMKTTAIKTAPKTEKYNEPKLYTSNDISKIFNKESNQNKISENFRKLSFKEYIEDDVKLTSKKTRRQNFDCGNIFITKNDNETKIKNGRKTKNPKRAKIHDKMSSDNIIIKVKALIFNFILSFLNNVIKLTHESYDLNKVELLKLDYKYVNNLQKEQNLEFINMKLKDLFSKEISGKYNIKKYPKDYNKNIIEKILNNIKVDENKTDKYKFDENKINKEDEDKGGKTLLFAFNMTLRDWLDIFTLKKSIKELIKCNNLIFEKKDFGIIEKCFVGIDNFLKIIKEKNGEYYLIHSIFYLYNYERWFYLKKTRI